MDETNVVPETNLDDAVSYTKGCYVGQEIIVRIKHRGHVAKKLTGLRFETDQQIEPGAIIKSTDNKEIGRVTSAVFRRSWEASDSATFVTNISTAGTNVSWSTKSRQLSRNCLLFVALGIRPMAEDLDFATGAARLLDHRTPDRAHARRQ